MGPQDSGSRRHGRLGFYSRRANVTAVKAGVPPPSICSCCSPIWSAFPTLSSLPKSFPCSKAQSGVLCPGSLPVVVPSQATASPSCSGFSIGLCHRKPGHCPADHHTAQLIPARTPDTTTAELVSFPLESCRHRTPEEDGGLLKCTELQPLHDFKPGFQNPWSSFPSLELCFNKFSSTHPSIQCSPQPFLYLSGGHTGYGMESKH